MLELRAKRMDLPPAGSESEFPKCEMGHFSEPSLEKKLGLRTECFTDSEKNVTEFVISRNEENGNDIGTYDENNADTISNMNTGNCVVVCYAPRDRIIRGRICLMFIDQSSLLLVTHFACSIVPPLDISFPCKTMLLL